MKVKSLILVLGLTLGVAAARTAATEPSSTNVVAEPTAAQEAAPQTSSSSAQTPEQFRVGGGVGSASLSDVLVNRLAREVSASDIERPARPNEVTVGRRQYSGILVQAVHSAHPLQLLNPWAPESAGSGEQNLVRDVVTGAPAGLKLIAINF